MSTQAIEQEISDNKTTNTEDIINSNEETPPQQPEEEEEEEKKKKNNDTGFYQEKTYILASTKEKRVYKSSITDQQKPDTLQDMIMDLQNTSLTEKDRIYRESVAALMNLNKNLVDQSICNDLELFITELAEHHFSSNKEWRKGMRLLFKKYPKIGVPKKAAMRRVYLNLLRLNKINKNAELEKHLIAKASRTKSGVMVVTVLTSPYPKV